jgi:hypothetical protein
MLDPDDIVTTTPSAFPATSDSVLRAMTIGAAIFVVAIVSVGLFSRSDHASQAALRPISNAPVLTAAQFSSGEAPVQH